MRTRQARRDLAVEGVPALCAGSPVRQQGDIPAGYGDEFAGRKHCVVVGAAEECVYIRGEFRVMLEQEPVR